MDAQDFKYWLDATETKTAQQLIQKLGWSRQKAEQVMQSVKAGKPVGLKTVDELAMSALAQGLKPWSDYER